MTSLSKYSVIETPLNKWAVIYPMAERAYSTSRLVMPKWLPANHTHAGIFNTLEEACSRMASLRECE